MPSDSFGADSGMPDDFIALFVVFAVLAVVIGIASAAYRANAARQLARNAGLDEDAAARVAVLDENGLTAAYVASALRGGTTQVPGDSAPAPAAPRPVAERLAELEELRSSGAITEAEHAARRQAIIDSI